MAFLIVICFAGGIFLFWSGWQNQPLKETFNMAVKGKLSTAPEGNKNTAQPQ